MKLGMGNIMLVYAVTACIFFLIDLFWLGIAAKGLYQRYIGSLLRDQVNWSAALLFYVVYIGGIQVFVSYPALLEGSGIVRTALRGGMLGFFAYSTFDLTCLALLRKWSITIAVTDILWGTLLTGSTAAIAVWVSRTVFKIG